MPHEVHAEFVKFTVKASIPGSLPTVFKTSSQTEVGVNMYAEDSTGTPVEGLGGSGANSEVLPADIAEGFARQFVGAYYQQGQYWGQWVKANVAGIDDNPWPLQNTIRFDAHPDSPTDGTRTADVDYSPISDTEMDVTITLWLLGNSHDGPNTSYEMPDAYFEALANGMLSPTPVPLNPWLGIREINDQGVVYPPGDFNWNSAGAPLSWQGKFHSGGLGSLAPLSSQTNFSFGCFMRDTIFRTLKDCTEVNIAIQDLVVGDPVKTEVFVNQRECQFSQEGFQRIKCIRNAPLTAEKYAERVRVLPKDAVSEGTPDKDLYILGGHGLYFKEMKDEYKNEHCNGGHITYSKEHMLTKGDFIKLLAQHCSLCRELTDEEKEEAKKSPEKMRYYHLEIDDKEGAQHALITHNMTSESLIEH